MNNNPTIKPGWTTSEFWVTVLMGLTPILTIVFKHDVTSEVQSWAMVASAIASAGYIVSRVLVKRKALDVTASIAQTNAGIVAAQPASTGQTVYVQSAVDTTTPLAEVTAPTNPEPGTASAGLPIPE